MEPRHGPRRPPPIKVDLSSSWSPDSCAAAAATSSVTPTAAKDAASRVAAWNAFRTSPPSGRTLDALIGPPSPRSGSEGDGEDKGAALAVGWMASLGNQLSGVRLQHQQQAWVKPAAVSSSVVGGKASVPAPTRLSGSPLSPRYPCSPRSPRSPRSAITPTARHSRFVALHSEHKDIQRRCEDRNRFLASSKVLHAQSYVVLRKEKAAGNKAKQTDTTHDVLFQFGEFCYRDPACNLGFKDLDWDNFALVLKVLQQRQGSMPFLCHSPDLTSQGHAHFAAPLQEAQQAALFCGAELLRRGESALEEAWNERLKMLSAKPDLVSSQTVDDDTFLSLSLAAHKLAEFERVQSIVSKIFIGSVMWCVIYHAGRFVINCRDAARKENALLNTWFPKITDNPDVEMNLATYVSDPAQKYRAFSMMKMKTDRVVAKTMQWTARISSADLHGQLAMLAATAGTGNNVSKKTKGSAYQNGYHQTYIIQALPEEAAAQQTTQRAVYVRVGNWCYEGDALDLGAKRMTMAGVPMIIPILQSQQGSLRFAGESKNLVPSSLAGAVFAHLARIGGLFEESLVQKRAAEVIDAASSHRDGKITLAVMPEEFFDVELSPSCSVYDSIELVASKTIMRGVTLVLVYHDGHIYCSMGGGDGSHPLMDVAFPDLTPDSSQRERRLIVDDFGDAYPDVFSLSAMVPRGAAGKINTPTRRPTPPPKNSNGGRPQPSPREVMGAAGADGATAASNPVPKDLNASACNDNKTPDKGGLKSTTSSLADLPNIIVGIQSEDEKRQFDCTTAIRKLLSIERNPPIQEVIDTGIIPRLIAFLGKDDKPTLQFEAAWALTNIASGTSHQCLAILEKGAVPEFIRLMQSPCDDVREQVVWALGNIAGDSPQNRNLVLQAGALEPVLEQLRQNAKISMLRNAAWTLSNFCRGKPQPPFEWVSPALPTLGRLIFLLDDEVLADACWALSYLSDGPNEKIAAVIESGVCMRLVELLMHPSLAVQTPVLRTVGNIVTGDKLQTQEIINCSALPCLLSLLSSVKKSIKKEAVWAISNITAGSSKQIQAVREANIFPPLVHLLRSAEWAIKKEAAWAISNATSGGTPEQIEYLVSCGCIPPFCDLLTGSDAKIVTVALEALMNTLNAGELKKSESGENPYAVHVKNAGGVEQINKLQQHQNQGIYEKSVRILERHFTPELALPG